MKHMKILSITALLMFVITTDAKLYKWVDENGKVHYSDKMPADQIGNAHEKLSEQGVVKEKVDRELTDEEKVAQAEQIQKELNEQQRLAQEAKDLAAERNKILMSYSSADQITRLKEERISALRRNIETAESNLIIQEKNQKELMSRAADKERSGEVVSDVFLSQIEQIKDQIAYQKQFIIDKTAEINTTEKKYDSELSMYLKFTGNSDTAGDSESK